MSYNKHKRKFLSNDWRAQLKRGLTCRSSTFLEKVRTYQALGEHKVVEDRPRRWCIPDVRERNVTTSIRECGESDMCWNDPNDLVFIVSELGQHIVSDGLSPIIWAFMKWPKVASTRNKFKHPLITLCFIHIIHKHVPVPWSCWSIVYPTWRTGDLWIRMSQLFQNVVWYFEPDGNEMFMLKEAIKLQSGSPAIMSVEPGTKSGIHKACSLWAGYWAHFDDPVFLLGFLWYSPYKLSSTYSIIIRKHRL